MIQISITLQEDDTNLLDQWAQEEGLDNRSAMIRKLIRMEGQRRNVYETLTEDDTESQLAQVTA